MITPAFNLTATERVLPKLALDFTTASLDSRVTFTRTTGASNPATYTNSSGYIANSTNDAPRFDYDPIALTCKGLLIEESRTNLCYPSDTFGSPWTQNGSFIDTNATTAPTNTSVGSKLREATTTGGHSTSFPYTKAIGVPISFSIYAKADQRTRIRVTIDAGYGDVTFDLSNGTIAAGSNGTITNVGNGWYRCSISKTTQWGSATACTISLVSTGTTVSYTGIANYGAFIWGAQFEDGAFATSYIPTTSAALTRNADVATMTGTNFSDWYNQSQGSFVTEYQLEGFGTTQSRTGIGVSNGTTGERMRTLVTASTQVGSLGNGSGTSFTFLQTVPNVTSNTNKTAYAYALNNAAGCSNAGAVNTDTSFTPPNVDRATIGCAEDTAASLFTNGWIKKVMYYNIRLTNVELQSITK